MYFLMSIKPKYATLILSGKKTAEIRKSKFGASKDDVVVIYSTKPEGRIVGSFVVNEVLWERTEELWKHVGKQTGLTYNEFMEYARGHESMCAIIISDVVSANGLTMEQMKLKVPQSYRRITDEECFALLNRVHKTCE